MAEVGAITHEHAIGEISKEINSALKDEMDAGITCPFCGEAGFDKYGLKYHLSVCPCDEYTDASAS